MSEYREATGNAWKPEKDGDFVEGLLTRVETNVGPNSSMMYHIEQLKDNEPISVWGSTVLDIRMGEVKVGQQVKITYKGEAKTGGRGGHKPKIFKVEYKDPEVPEDKDLADVAEEIMKE